jgi:hypothetical protein
MDAAACFPCPVQPGSSHRQVLGLLVLFGLVFAVYAGTTSRDHTNDDVYGAGLAAWRIAATGAPWLEGVDTAEIGIARNHSASAAPAPKGHLVVDRSPGVVAAGVPAYWLSGESDDPADFSLLPGALMAAFLAALSVVLFRLSIVEAMSPAAEWVGTTAFAFATPVWSVAANGIWTHTVTVLGLTGVAWAASRDRWWLVGAFGGVALWGRLHVSLVVAVVGLGVALSRRNPRIAVAVGVTSARSWVSPACGPTGCTARGARPGGTTPRPTSTRRSEEWEGSGTRS